MQSGWLRRQVARGAWGTSAPVRAARRLTFLLTYACSAGALVLLWLVYPQDYSYGAAAGTGLQFYPGVVRAPRLPHSALSPQKPS